MSYSKVFDEHLRLTILRQLEDQSDYALNESLLLDLLEPFGFTVSRDKLATELSWLKEQGVVNVEEVASMTVATLTKRGADVAKGRATVPGVKRPSPQG